MVDIAPRASQHGQRPESRVATAAVLAAFFLTGGTALVYQVVWVRMLSVTFGATVLAVATVVAVFMGGLALGSLLIGRVADRITSRAGLLRFYGLLELGVGAYCLSTPWLFAQLDPVYAWIYGLVEVNFHLFSLFRFLLSALLLLIPTMLMGGTLPVISRYLVRYDATLGRRIGLLYGFNTLGAVAGVVLSAFVLVPFLGVTGSLMLAVAVNLAIAAGFLVAAQATTGSAATPAPGVQDAAKACGGRAHDRVPAGLVLAVVAAAGFAALAYEVVWFRILGMTIGNTVYAFGAMLAVFLLGLALGSHLAAVFIDRMPDRLRGFALLQAATAGVVLASLPLLGVLPLVFMALVDGLGLDFAGYQAAVFLTSASVVLVPTLLMGMAFPLAIRLVVDETPGLGRGVGTVYAVNTLGGVLGSFAAGFVLIPFFGIKVSLVLLAVLNLALAGLLLAARGSRRTSVAGSSRRPGRRIAVVAGVVFLVLGVAALYPQWDRRLLSSGVYFYAARYAESFRTGDLAGTLARERRVVYYNEGVTGTVSVVDFGGNLALAINGKVTAGVPGNTFTHTLLGALPALLHPRPRKVALVGLASGVTLGAIEQFDVSTVDVIEISPEVVDAAPLFAPYNHDALTDPRARVIIDDGRARLAYGDRRYDVVVSEPPVPLSSGVANLFTVEFYRAMARSLAADGVACQWIHAYGIEPDALKLVLRSFRAVFPHATLWQYDTGNILLIGTRAPLTIDYERLVTRLEKPRVAALMAEIGVVSPELLLGGLTLDAPALAGFAGPGPLNTDDRPRLEFAVARSMFRDTELANYNALARRRAVVRPRLELMSVDGTRRYRFLGLEDALGEPWRPRYAGFSIRTDPVTRAPRAPAPGVSKRIRPVAEWEVPETGRALRVSGRPLADPSDTEALQALLPATGGDVVGGRIEVAGRTAVWRVHERRDSPLLTVVWACPGRDQAYVGEVINSPRDRDAAARMAREIVRGLKCIQ